MKNGKSSGGNGGNGKPGLKSRRWALHRQPKRRPKGDVRADINVTPLVDVVLVLLIIFMVVTPMLARGISVDLPITKHHEKKNDDGKDIIVSLSKDGDVYVDTDRVILQNLVPKLEEEKRRHPDKGLFMKADNRITYGKAREVMEACNKAGYEDIQLGTEELKDKK